MTQWCPEPDSLARVDAQSLMWQQGDVFDGTNLPIIRLVSRELPLTVPPSESRGRVAAEEHAKVAIVSQTCDVVRQCIDRPQLVIAPIIELTGEDASNAGRKRIPRYLPLKANRIRRPRPVDDRREERSARSFRRARMRE